MTAARAILLALLTLAAAALACSDPPPAPPPPEPEDASEPPDADVDFPGPDAGRDAGPDAGCVPGSHVQLVTDCFGQQHTPDECLADLSGANTCDGDGDGLPDDFEVALSRQYQPVFAFNSGAAGGNLETHWPANVKHFLSRARLAHRPDGQSEVVVDPKPTPSTVAAATSGAAHANDPAAGQGADFWLCLNDATAETRVATKIIALNLPDGLDLVTAVHPANATLDASTHLFVSYQLFFAYNAHSSVDDHEGDWEGLAVFVNRSTGTVDAAWFDRHGTTDDKQLIDVAAFPPRDPAAEAPAGNVDSADAAPHGLRFWDFKGDRHHVVAYVSTGGHAMYDYPGNTYIVKLGPRDTHNGDADKLLPWRSRFTPKWFEQLGEAVTVVDWNAGEPGRVLVGWARYRGQWGCDDGVLGKSWPGPFGNARHPRPMFEKAWGSPPQP